MTPEKDKDVFHAWNLNNNKSHDYENNNTYRQKTKKSVEKCEKKVSMPI